MTKITRRTAMQQASVSALAAVVLPELSWPAEPSRDFPARDPLRPPPILLPGFHAYADAHSVAAGESIRFHVSSTAAYELGVFRLGLGVDDEASDEIVHVFPAGEPAQQAIYPGSCVVIERGLQPAEVSQALAIECWVRLFRVDGPQAILTQAAGEQGFGLGLAAGGELQFAAGSSGTLIGPRLERLRWYHIVGQWTGTQLELWLDGKRIADAAATIAPNLENAPLILAARTVDQQLQHLLDGDIALPILYGRALSPEVIGSRLADRGLTAPAADGVLACWPMTEERGDRLSDFGPSARHGRIVNHATWMIGGPSFDGNSVPRYGTEYQPAEDPRRGHGLRFAADDLYDCGWAASHEWTVPADARSGVYCGRARFELDGKPMSYHITFIVRRPESRPKTPLLVVCSSNTWLAYNSAPFTLNRPVGTYWYVSTEGGANSHPQAPAFSMYRSHAAGQPTYQLGLRMPWPVAGPDVWYSPPDTRYSHLMRGERFAHVWLEKNGYEYDMVTDLDVHRDPGLLAGYQAVLINGHSEYWSSEAYAGLDRYLRGGGNALVFSGNTMFWRVSFSSDGSVMECRKFDERIGGRPTASIGELYHSHDGRRGSLLRECGQPAWQVVGLECDGWGGNDKDGIGVYVVETPEHFLFHQPEEVGLAKDATFGHAPDGGVPKAIGHEWDVRVSRLNAITKNIPAGAALPEEPAGIVTLARGVRKDTNALDYFTQPTTAPDGTVAEMIYWERPQGGRVFHGGAIAVGWALSADPKLQTLVRNVLHHFGVPRRS